MPTADHTPSAAQSLEPQMLLRAAEKLVSAWDMIGDARGPNKAQAIKRRAEALEELREAISHERGVVRYPEGLGADSAAPAPALMRLFGTVERAFFDIGILIGFAAGAALVSLLSWWPL